METQDIKSVLIVRGAFEDMYEPAWKRALDQLGLTCDIFDAHKYTLPGILGRIERHALRGYGVWKLRRALIKHVSSEKPDITLLYQGHYFNRKTVERLKPYTFVVGYHNDDPFGPKKGILRYRHLHPALPAYDGYHVYRQINIEEAYTAGVKKAAILMSYYQPWVDYPRTLNESDMKKYSCDVVFAGHCEEDCRIDCLSKVVRKGVDVKIYGEPKRWKKFLTSDVIESVNPRPNVIGEDYRKVLSGAKIALCFFSKSNRDLYTRRVFEIPACGTFLLAERTPVMEDLYKEGTEAEFFSCSKEFVDKVLYYIKHDDKRREIARAGYKKVCSSGHDIHSRMKQWLADVEKWRIDDRTCQ